MTTSTDADTDTTSGTTLAVVLAAGSGSRFDGDGHKLFASIEGRPLIEHALARAIESAIGPVLVVTGAADLTPIDDGLLAQVHLVHNARWADGQSTSLQTALAEASGHFAADAIVVGLADQPGISPEAWRRVAASDAPIAIATYGGARRNPVRLARQVWHLMPTEGDAGARAVARVSPHLVEEIPCPGSPDDIDTLEDLRSWQNRSSTNSP